MERIKVLFVDDDIFLGEIMANALKEYGYEFYFTSSLGGVLASIKELRPNIIFLDVDLNGLNSIDFAPRIKATVPSTPLLFVSSHTDGDTIAEAFEAGAEGYLKKPFDHTELIAYIHKYANHNRQYIITIGELSLDTETRILTHKGDPIKQLSETEYKLLKLFAASPEQLISKQEVVHEIWGKEEYANDQSLNNFISKLRKYLSADQRVNLLTVSKLGYKLTVTPCRHSPARHLP